MSVLIHLLPEVFVFIYRQFSVWSLHHYDFGYLHNYLSYNNPVHLEVGKPLKDP